MADVRSRSYTSRDGDAKEVQQYGLLMGRTVITLRDTVGALAGAVVGTFVRAECMLYTRDGRTDWVVVKGRVGA